MNPLPTHDVPTPQQAPRSGITSGLNKVPHPPEPEATAIEAAPAPPPVIVDAPLTTVVKDSAPVVYREQLLRDGHASGWGIVYTVDGLALPGMIEGRKEGIGWGYVINSTSPNSLLIAWDDVLHIDWCGEDVAKTLLVRWTARCAPPPPPPRVDAEGGPPPPPPPHIEEAVQAAEAAEATVVAGPASNIS